MFNLGLKAYVGIAIGVAVTAAVALSYRHYSGLVESNAQLTGQVATLKEDVSREKARADAFEKSIDRWDSAAKALEGLTTAQREAGAYSRELKDVLSKHDLGALAKRKPGLIERRVNDGSDRALRLLEQSTQATAADGGQAATAAGAARP